jgi:hypothetical protein
MQRMDEPTLPKPQLTEPESSWRPSSWHLIIVGGRLRRRMIGLNVVPVFAKYKTNESDYHQDGSGYHYPMRVLHRGEHAQFRRPNPARIAFSRSLIFSC